MNLEERTSLERWLGESRAWIEEGLELLLPGEEEHPAHIHRAMRYALFGGGKRLRPALCRLICTSLEGAQADALRPAAALELVHTYSLVHDDLPCMDDDELRRGRATLHVAFDEATAVLTGDALLTHAFEVLCHPSLPRATELMGCLARAAGSRGMVGGQTLDLSLKSTDPGELGDMHDRKTGALFAAACEMGALAAGAGASTCRLAGQYGQDLGRAFQATDDLLDVTGDAGTLGKTPGKDRTLSRPTLVAALGLEKAQAKARDFGEAARESLKALGWGPDHLAGFFVEFVLSRRN